MHSRFFFWGSPEIQRDKNQKDFDEYFKSLLIKAARGDQTMRDTQDKFFDDVYWTPATD
jgi:hypothetical protein